MHTQFRGPGGGSLPFLILGGIGLLFLAALLYVGGLQAAFVLRAQRATGTFQGSVAHSGGNHGGTFLYPRFLFKTATGQSVVLTGKNGSTSESYSDGQEVPILYDPAAPDHALLDSFWTLWTPTLVLGVFVLGFLVLPLVLWYTFKKS